MKKNTAGKNFITALIIIGVFVLPGGSPVCLTVDQGVSRQVATDVRNLIAITVMITSYIGRNPLQMTNHHPMTNRQRTVPMIVAHPKKHIIISTTIVTVILIHLIAIIQEKIHMEHLVPQQSVHTILMMRGMMTSIWMVIMMITDMTMTVTMQMV